MATPQCVKCHGETATLRWDLGYRAYCDACARAEQIKRFGVPTEAATAPGHYEVTESEQRGIERMAAAICFDHDEPQHCPDATRPYDASRIASYARSCVENWYGDQTCGTGVYRFSTRTARYDALVTALITAIIDNHAPKPAPACARCSAPLDAALAADPDRDAYCVECAMAIYADEVEDGIEAPAVPCCATVPGAVSASRRCPNTAIGVFALDHVYQGRAQAQTWRPYCAKHLRDAVPSAGTPHSGRVLRQSAPA